MHKVLHEAVDEDFVRRTSYIIFVTGTVYTNTIQNDRPGLEKCLAEPKFLAFLNA